MRIIAVGVIIGAAVVMLTFQNCNKNMAGDAPSTAVSNVQLTKFGLVDDALKSVKFFIQDSEIMTRAGNTFTVKYNKILDIDLQTGDIEESNDLNDAVSLFCLPDNLKTELIAILNDSEVCKAQSPETVKACTQALKTPYCELETGRDVYSLGSATDGCGHNAVDLCDDRASVLKAFIDKVNANYSNYSCP